MWKIENIIAIIIFLGGFLFFMLIGFGWIDDSAAVNIIVGSISSLMGVIASYYWGSSNSKKEEKEPVDEPKEEQNRYLT